MVTRRPFNSREDVFTAADSAWSECGPEDYQEAFSHHPRIGDRKLENAAAGTKEWAKGEQAGMNHADDQIRQAIAEGNRAYEAKFGRVYLVCATGKTESWARLIAPKRSAKSSTVERCPCQIWR